jgi:hypothetical protein
MAFMLEVCIFILLLMIVFGRRLQGLSYTWLDEALLRDESRFGKLVWTALLSLLLLLAAIVYTRPDTACNNLGFLYAQLAENPFDFAAGNPLSFRILTPLISYAVGLRGANIIFTNLILAGVLIGTVYSIFRKISPRPGDAFLAAVVVTFSLVVLTTIHCGGYCDILTYLVVFLMWHFRSKRFLFYVLFLIGLFNRESIVFLLPWLVFISLEIPCSKTRRLAELAVGFALAILIYYLFRQWVGAQAEIEFSGNYYLRPLLDDPLKHFRNTFYYHGLGFFSVYKLLWCFPVLAAAAFWRDRNFRPLIGFALLLGGAWVQLFLAFDTSRMFTLGFMIMFLSLEYLLRTDEYRFRKWAFAAVLINLLVPQMYTAAEIVEIWQSLSSHLLLPYL